MNNKFDLIKNIHTQEVLILIFENNFIKENVQLKIIEDKLILFYKDGKITFRDVDEEAIKEINSAERLIIAEFNLKDGFTDGNIKHDYFATLCS